MKASCFKNADELHTRAYKPLDESFPRSLRIIFTLGRTQGFRHVPSGNSIRRNACVDVSSTRLLAFGFSSDYAVLAAFCKSKSSAIMHKQTG